MKAIIIPALGWVGGCVAGVGPLVTAWFSAGAADSIPLWALGNPPQREHSPLYL